MFLVGNFVTFRNDRQLHHSRTIGRCYNQNGYTSTACLYAACTWGKCLWMRHIHKLKQFWSCKRRVARQSEHRCVDDVKGFISDIIISTRTAFAHKHPVNCALPDILNQTLKRMNSSWVLWASTILASYICSAVLQRNRVWSATSVTPVLFSKE